MITDKADEVVKKLFVSFLNRYRNILETLQWKVVSLSWKIGKHSEWIATIKPFVSKYNWQGINFSLEKDGWIKLEKKK